MKAPYFPLLLCAVLLTVAASGQQPIRLSVTSTALPALPGDTIAADTSALALHPVYTLFTSKCTAGACSFLPVKLLSFTGNRLDQNTVQLKWKTTNEMNDLGFDVERSLGIATQFVKVAFVPAAPAGNLVNLYQINDPNSFAGTSYYRLKQIDIDSQYVYSPVVAVNNTGQDESLTLYPNPASSVLNLKIVSNTSATARIAVYDAQGKIITALSAFMQKGANQQQITVSRLPRGAYFVKLDTGTGTTLVASFLKD